jgi:hypothetical protein
VKPDPGIQSSAEKPNRQRWSQNSPRTSARYAPRTLDSSSERRFSKIAKGPKSPPLGRWQVTPWSTNGVLPGLCLAVGGVRRC